MIKRIFVLLACIFWGAVSLSAQSSKLIKELESKRGELQKQIADTESLLKNTKKDVGSQLNSLALLTGQIEERKRYILAINNGNSIQSYGAAYFSVELLNVKKITSGHFVLLAARFNNSVHE